MFRLDKPFFQKYQKELLWIAKRRWARWILGIHKINQDIFSKGKLCQITPSSIHVLQKDGQITANFYSDAYFAKNLAACLSPFYYFQTWKGIKKLQFSPIGILGMIAACFIPKLGFLGFASTTTDFNPHSGTTSPCDGTIINNPSSAVWATVHDAASGTTATATDAQQTPYTRSSAGNYIISRVIVNFDTSPIGSGGTISSAEYHAFCESSQDQDTVHDFITVVSATPGSTSTVATSDYSQLSTTEWVTHITITSLTTSAFNTFTLNATGLAGISKTGVTSTGLKEGHDLDNVAIAAANWNYAIFTSADGASNFPFLRVTYTPAAKTGAAFLLNFV